MPQKQGINSSFFGNLSIESSNFALIQFKRFKKLFGDLSGMMQKLKDAQQKVEETKARLNTVLVSSESNNGNVKITVTANREVKAVEIADELFEDKEALEDYLILALNDALGKATKINEAELAAAAKDGMPNIPGLDFFK